MAGTLLRNAHLLGGNGLFDLSIVDGRVAALAPAGSIADAGSEIVDLEGRTVTPGLWDEHVHFTQWTIRRSRIDLTGTRSRAEVLERVAAALESRDRDDDSYLTGYGFRDANWAEPASREALDRLAGGAAVVLVSGDLHCSWMSSAAAARLDVEIDEFGLVREAPWIAALSQLEQSSRPTDADFRGVGEAAAQRGVVGVVDFETSDNIALWPPRIAAGVDSLRVEAALWPEHLDAALAKGLRTGDPLDPHGLVTVGPLKVVADGSLNTRTALCWDPYPGLGPDHPHPCGLAVGLDLLPELLARAQAAGFGTTVHAIGDRANSEVLDVFEALGTGGRIEHAQLVNARDIPRFAALGIVASVQPEHAMDDRDVADRYWRGRTGDAFPLASLLAAGATLRFGSDAPVAPLDPWQGIATAVTRSRDEREPWHPEQRIPLEVALAGSMRGRLRPQLGDLADLAILDADPFGMPVEALRTMPVAGTLLGGRWTWRGL